MLKNLWPSLWKAVVSTFGGVLVGGGLHAFLPGCSSWICGSGAVATAQTLWGTLHGVGVSSGQGPQT